MRTFIVIFIGFVLCGCNDRNQGLAKKNDADNVVVPEREMPESRKMPEARVMKQRDIKSRTGQSADQIRADQELEDHPAPSDRSKYPTSDPDPAIQAMINAGTYTPEAARNIRAIREEIKKQRK